MRLSGMGRLEFNWHFPELKFLPQHCSKVPISLLAPVDPVLPHLRGLQLAIYLLQSSLMPRLLLLNYMNRSKGIRSWDSSKGRLFSFHSQLSQKNLFIYQSENKLDACSSGDPCAVPFYGKMPRIHQKGVLCHVAHSHSCLGHNSLRACKGGNAEARNYCRKQAQREKSCCFRSCLFFWLH